MRIATCAGTVSQEGVFPDRVHLLDLCLRLASRFPDIQVTQIETADGASREDDHRDSIKVGRGDSPWRRLLFEQVDLPRAALEAGADLLFIPYASSPLRSGVPVIAAGRGDPPADGEGAVERVRWSLGRAGLRGAAAVLVFADQPASGGGGIHFVSLPPSVGPAFRAVPAPDDLAVRSRLGLPDAYVLCLAPPKNRLEFLLAAWTWVDGSVGDSIPLVAAAVPSHARESLRTRAHALDVAGSVHIVGEVVDSELPSLFRGAQAYLDPGGSSAQALRWALACGLPVAAMDSAASGAALADSGYLVGPEDSRALGAACLTLLVEPEVSDSLRQKGLVRAMAFHGDGPLQALYEVFVKAARRSPPAPRQGGRP